MRLKEFRWFLVVFLAFVAIVAIYHTFPGKTTFAGSHTMYKLENSSGYGSAELCRDCHGDIVENITYSKAHSSTACICHGYNPNATNPMRDINLKHNLTKNVYCTNCHSNYNEAGDLYVYGGGSLRNVANQSAHYIRFNKSNATMVDEIYNRSWRYFNKSFGPLD